MEGASSLLADTLKSPSAFVAVFAFIAAALLIYRAFLAPLSKIPGPKVTAITSLLLKYHEFKGDRTIWIDDLHTTYGPVVRVSPSEVSFNNHEALKEIYGIKSDYAKSTFYDLFVYYNERNTFTSLDKPSHSAKKKLVADRYTKSYVVQDAVATQVQEHASRFLEQVSKSPSELDVYTWLHYYALDCITNHLYGSTHGTHTLVKPDHRGIIYDLSGVKHRTRLYTIFYFGTIMSILERSRAFLRRLAGMSSDFHVRGTRLNDYGKESVTNFRCSSLEKDSVSTCSKLFKVSPPPNENAIAAECMDHLVAGVDTTGDAMCILMWRISTPEYQHIQDKIHQELQSISANFSPNGTAPMSIVDKLPYLNAVIHESLRWRAPVPMTLFRLVPPHKLWSPHLQPLHPPRYCRRLSSLLPPPPPPHLPQPRHVQPRSLAHHQP